MSNPLQAIFDRNELAPEHCDWQHHGLAAGYDPGNRVLMTLIAPRTGRPCFTPEHLEDLRTFQLETARAIDEERGRTGANPIDYLVYTSNVSEIFNLGGDLAFFLRTIRTGDRPTLSAYAHLSIDVLYRATTNLAQPLTSIAVIEGTALGAAFEAALAMDVIIAERQVQIGFPEVVFNMFPGMGAYSFLSRRLSPAGVERMIMSGRIYTAEELHEMGLVDVLAEPGKAGEALAQFIRRDRKTCHTRRGIRRMRDRVNPVMREELEDVAEIWVDAAMSLPEKDLKMMERLVRAQDRKLAATPIDRARRGA